MLIPVPPGMIHALNQVLQVSADARGFLRGLGWWFALSLPATYTNAMVGSALAGRPRKLIVSAFRSVTFKASCRLRFEPG